MKKLTFILMFTAVSCNIFAQFSRTSYFMEGSSQRIQLNPALRPTKGFVDIPAIGALNVAAFTNSLTVKDITNFIDSEDKFYHSDVYNRLKDDNKLNINVNTDIVSFGFYKGKGFWTGNIGLRTDIGASIPRAMFEYSRDFYDEAAGTTGVYDIRNQSVNINAYVETGVGYSRILTDKLTVGARVKFLLGVANADAKIDQFYVNVNDTYAEVISKGHIDISASGLELETSIDENNKEYIDDADFDKFGFGGYGAGIDLGVSYKAMDNLTLSAAVLDFGFISWDKSSTTSGIAQNNFREDFDYENYYWNTDGIFDLEEIGYEIVDPKSRTTSLATTLVLGGEYSFMQNKLSAGLLSVTRFGKIRTLSELTLSANYRPKKWLETTFSYSVIQSGFKTFGLGVKVGPVFLATDYMYLGKKSKNASVYLGISVPLGKKKSEEK